MVKLKAKFLVVVILFTLLSGCNQSSKKGKNQLLLAIALSQNNSASQTTCPPANLDVAALQLADSVVYAPANDPNTEFKNDKMAVDGVCGAGKYAGSTDVYTLDSTGKGASIVLQWSGKTVQNTSGLDFVVYENAFLEAGTNGTYYLEPIIVEVSLNGTDFCGFNPSYTGATSPVSQKRTNWINFAGLSPVLWNVSTNQMTLDQLFSQTTDSGDGHLDLGGGGDGFDLANLNSSNKIACEYVKNVTSGSCSSTVVSNIQTNGFKYVCLTSDQDGGFLTPVDSYGGGPDIDGVVARSLK